MNAAEGMTLSNAPFQDRSPGIKDVAAIAGVSIGTVSNVLNHPERVSPVLRKRVLAVIDYTGYVPNESARLLRGLAAEQKAPGSRAPDDRLSNGVESK